MKRKWWLLCAGVVVALALGACGDSDDEEGADSGDASGEEAEASKVTVKTAEFAFLFPSTTIKGGLVELTVDNTAGKEPHEVGLARLEAGKTLADVKAASPDAAPSSDAQGGPGPVLPGKTAVYTGNLPAGTYVVSCNVPLPDGTSHADNGMITEIKIESGEDGDIPEGDVTVEARDFDFTNLDKLKAGKQTVRVENTGKEDHFWALFALAPGKTAADLGAFFGGQAPPGPPPFTGLPGLVSTLPAGGKAARTLELTPGTTYVMTCLIESPDGQSHAQKGMTKEFKIS